MRLRLARVAGGDRQFVEILAAVASDRMESVTVACELALEAGVASSDYVLNTVSRLKAPPRAARWSPRSLKLAEEPQAGRDDGAVFMQSARNVVFVGGPGSGKSHLATAIGMNAVHSGKSVRFSSVVDLVNQLEAETFSAYGPECFDRGEARPSRCRDPRRAGATSLSAESGSAME